MISQLSSQSEDKFDDSILNAPKQKFKTPEEEPPFYLLEGSDNFCLSLGSISHQSEFEKLKFNLNDNTNYFHEYESEEEKENDKEVFFDKKINDEKGNRYNCNYFSKKIIFSSLMKSSESINTKEDSNYLFGSNSSLSKKFLEEIDFDKDLSFNDEYNNNN